MHSQNQWRRRFFGVQGSPGKCTYLLPIRRRVFAGPEADALAKYLRTLRDAGCEVLVVDGSPSAVFTAHAQLWRGLCRHVPVNRRFRYLNDKVNGIHTGVELAGHGSIILADDDIRYTAQQIEEICRRLETHQVVRPQNFIAPLPWWGAMEASRMLINRATLVAGDYPGTCAFRRDAMLRAGEYDGDVLFDNEEMIRHFACRGLRIDYAIDFFVRKGPPTLRKWVEQRARQAYEDFPLRAKTLLFAGLLPAALLATLVAGPLALAIFGATICGASIALAALGWSRGEARKFFPLRICFFAPLWIFERALSTYWAIGWFILRRGYPFGDRLLRKGVGRDWFAAHGSAAHEML